MITKQSELYLAEFNPKFRKSISGYENTTIHPDGTYHTIIDGGKKVGIIGFIPRGSNNFEQIAILPKYRHQGITQKASTLLAKLYNLDHLNAHIDDKNIASIKAHLKSGFKQNIKLTKTLFDLNKLPKNSKIYTKKYDN